ncbi:hypothetical protein ANO11243_097350 [Dothideomycetidae sp. 11243]|nr:hypothetical protein ANO11243_097350 [fungal sp. No.11243]
MDFYHSAVDVAFDNQSLAGLCPDPFKDDRTFSDTLGAVSARACSPQALLAIPAGLPSTNATCCLPCPTTNFVFDSRFQRSNSAVAGLSGASAAAMAFILLSYAVLPSHATRVHFLNVNLVLSILGISLGFIIPSVNRADVCANAITPHSQASSAECFASGFFILGGGASAISWVFVRVLLLYLDMCHDVRVQRRGVVLAYKICGWLLPLALVASAMRASGVAYRFGPGACHINHVNSLLSFWSWALAAGGVTAVICGLTVFHVAHHYYSAQRGAQLQEHWRDPETAHDNPTIQDEYNRAIALLASQARPVLMAGFTLGVVVFFAIVFLKADHAVTDAQMVPARDLAWVTCLIKNPHHADRCTTLGQHAIISQQLISAALVMLSLIGLLLAPLMLRSEIWVAWWRLICRRGQSDSGQAPLAAEAASPGMAAVQAENGSVHHPPGEMSTTGAPSSFLTSTLSSPTVPHSDDEPISYHPYAAFAEFEGPSGYEQPTYPRVADAPWVRSPPVVINQRLGTAADLGNASGAGPHTHRHVQAQIGELPGSTPITAELPGTMMPVSELSGAMMPVSELPGSMRQESELPGSSPSARDGFSWTTDTATTRGAGQRASGLVVRPGSATVRMIHERGRRESSSRRSHVVHRVNK